MESGEMANEVEKLINGDLKELLVAKEDFMQFREIWLNHEKKDQIIGEAKHNGEVVFRYQTFAE
ncbi:MAG: hypothetical protein RR548_01050 [Carnobacterium sp.]|uniref:hypothetical protein n=1 Tax=Carnobacterium sp. TaxID=48221 RepID=UPI002FCB97BD